MLYHSNCQIENPGPLEEIDRVWQHAPGASSECPGCQTVTYECSSCHALIQANPVHRPSTQISRSLELRPGKPPKPKSVKNEVHWVYRALLVVGVFVVLGILGKDEAKDTEKYEQSLQDQQERIESFMLENSPWDGSVEAVKIYVKENFFDPKSFDAIQWGKVQQRGDHYVVYVRYRAKNSLGGYIIRETNFIMSPKGYVLRMEHIH